MGQGWGVKLILSLLQLAAQLIVASCVFARSRATREGKLHGAPTAFVAQTARVAAQLMSDNAPRAGLASRRTHFAAAREM